MLRRQQQPWPPCCLATGHPEPQTCSARGAPRLAPWSFLPEQQDGAGGGAGGAACRGLQAGSRGRDRAGLLKPIPPGPGRGCWKGALTSRGSALGQVWEPLLPGAHQLFASFSPSDQGHSH